MKISLFIIFLSISFNSFSEELAGKIDNPEELIKKEKYLQDRQVQKQVEYQQKHQKYHQELQSLQKKRSENE